VTPLIRAEELKDGSTRAVEHPVVGSIILVRKNGQAHAYRNRCPHTGAPLDWQPGRFLDPSGEHLLCALHGALFRIEDGACLAGPCRGEGLAPLPLVERGGRLYLAES